MDEILNIEYHTKRLVVKALNTSANHNAAAAKLGMCTRNLFRLKSQYNIKKVNGQFILIQKTVNESRAPLKQRLHDIYQ